MVVRFDDSLGALCRTVSDVLGRDALTRGVVLRDFSGKLSFMSAADLSSETLERLGQVLREALGPYAREDRLVAQPTDFGVSDLLIDPTIAVVNVVGGNVRLIDRRIVGADWLRKPAAPTSGPPRFVFNSLKGGVGRSTALAVCAAEVAAKSRRVLAVDLDMEAPGLGAMLLSNEDLPQFGFLDALVESGIGELDDEFFADLIAPSPLADHRGRIDVLPAFGLRSIQHPALVLSKIARAYLEKVDSDGHKLSVLDQVRLIVGRFAESGQYDAIMVDARAGLHETTAASVLGLGAEVFLFGLDEPQTFQGYSALLAHMAHLFMDDRQTPEWLERLTFVQGKAPASVELREQFADRCLSLLQSSGLVSSPQPPTSIALPAEPFENVPWKDDDEDDDLELNGTSGLQDTIAVLDDERFRLFQPLERRDLLASEVYRSSFGQLLDRIENALVAHGRK